MKLVRPYIPTSVRLQVIARQLHDGGQLIDVLAAISLPLDGQRLTFMLKRLFGDEKVHLDHDPPLCLRHIIDADKGLYDPDANDPNHLVYRTEEEHRLKTYVRGDGAQLSDAGKRRKEIKRKRKVHTAAWIKKHGFTNGLWRLQERARKRPSRWPPRGSRPMQWKPR